MSFLKMQGHVDSGLGPKYEAIEKVIEDCYASQLQPTPEEIAWAVKTTPITLQDDWSTKYM